MINKRKDTEKTTGRAKTRFLESTFDEVRQSKGELELKERVLQEKLGEIREKLQVTQREEKSAENILRDLMKIKERFTDLLRTEKTLRSQESFTEDDLQKVRQKLSKMKDLLEELED